MSSSSSSSSITSSSSSLYYCVPSLLGPLLYTLYHPFSHHLTQFCCFSYLPIISYPYHITLLLLILSTYLPCIPCQHVSYYALFSPSLSYRINSPFSLRQVMRQFIYDYRPDVIILNSRYVTHAQAHTHTDIHTNSFLCYDHSIVLFLT
jgi:hypothetical protein